jgi:hypothetical protein
MKRPLLWLLGLGLTLGLGCSTLKGAKRDECLDKGCAWSEKAGDCKCSEVGKVLYNTIIAIPSP